MSDIQRNISRPVQASPAVTSSSAGSFFIGLLAVAGIVASIIAKMWYLALVVLVLWTIVANIRIVPQEHAYIIERLGKFKTVLQEAGIPDFRFHALRHSFATRCVEEEFDIKSLSEILGHSSVKITMDRYVHPSMDFKKQQMNRLKLS